MPKIPVGLRGGSNCAGAKKKPTKVPYAAGGGRAKADDPETWGTRSEAEGRARLIIDGLGGGVGIELGDIRADLHLAGLDLDSCVQDSDVAPWAATILETLDSYAEVSPSGLGLKVFFYTSSKDVRWFLDLIGVEPDAFGCRRDVPGENARDHGPAIEVYLARRYFAVTDRRWPHAPDHLRHADRDVLEQLANLIPPKKTATGSGKHPGDNSRSAVAFRKGAALRRAGKTFEEMCDALREGPETATWVREKGEVLNLRELRRIWDRAGESNPGSNLPRIRVLAGLRHEATDAGLAALKHDGGRFYQRDRTLVRVAMIAAKAANGEITSTPGIVEVTHAYLARALGQAAQWERFDHLQKIIRIDPPGQVVDQIIALAGEWPFPVLAGVIGTPTIRPDGSLLTTEGYDQKTGLVLLGAPAMPQISDQPTRAAAVEALQLLNDLLGEFPFHDGGARESSVDRAVALSELMTPVLRGAMPVAPMHLASAPQAGTGKSYLADIASVIATGERAAVVAFSPNPEETEKRLVGAGLAGHPIIALDNASGEVQGDLLCQLTERPLLQLRRLGRSDQYRIPNSFCVFVNGNNAVVADDMVRRTIECRLDANMEPPETRVFQDNPLAKISRNRGAYIAACLTIARAYICADKPNRLPPLVSYESWSDLVRSPIVWLGCGDPVASQAGLRSSDPARQARANLFHAWAEELRIGAAHTTAEVINLANERDFGILSRPNLRSALLDVAQDRRGNEIDAKRLGKWLGRAENTVSGPLKLIVDRGDAKRPRWLLQRV